MLVKVYGLLFADSLLLACPFLNISKFAMEVWQLCSYT